MSDTVWAPRPLHNVQAALDDQVLYRRLYDVTANVAARHIGDELTRITAKNAAQLLMDDAKRMVGFLRDAGPGRLGLDEANPVFRVLFGDLSQQLQRSLGAAYAPSEVVPLSAQLSAELARALWSPVLRVMRRHSAEGRVPAEALMPMPGDAAYAELLEHLGRNTRQFKLDPGGAMQILHKSLSVLALSVFPDRPELSFPFGLRVDRASLLDRLGVTERLLFEAEPLRPSNEMHNGGLSIGGMG